MTDNPNTWTREERRALDKIKADIFAARASQLLALGFAGHYALRGDWSGAILAGVLVAILQFTLPHVPPSLVKRAAELDAARDGPPK